MNIKCNICGVTSDTNNGWRGCKKCGQVCTSCCRKCEHHTEYSGLHTCTFKTPEMEINDEIKELQKQMNRADWQRRKAEKDHDYVTAAIRKTRIRNLERRINELNARKANGAKEFVGALRP